MAVRVIVLVSPILQRKLSFRSLHTEREVSKVNSADGRVKPLIRIIEMGTLEGWFPVNPVIWNVGCLAGSGQTKHSIE